jgi:riboflavin kinase
MDEKYAFALRKIALLGGLNNYVAVSSRELGDALDMSQQSASKRILELLEEKYLIRDLGARKQRIKITALGADELRKEYNEYRRIFELTDHVTLHGKVVSGMGEGSYYVTQKPYMDQFLRKLRFKPFEGTFNLKLTDEDIDKLEVIRNVPGHMIEGFEKDGRTFGSVIAYKAKIMNLDAAIIIPERSHYADTVEVICKFHLRRTLGVNDGDPLDIVIDLSPLSSADNVSGVSQHVE